MMTNLWTNSQMCVRQEINNTVNIVVGSLDTPVHIE